MSSRERDMPGSEAGRDPIPLVSDEPYPFEPRRRPWYLIASALLLVVLVAVVWGKWSESRTENQLLRAELKQVYFETEAIRTQANQAQQRIGLLEQQVRSLVAERSEILKRLQDAGGEAPAKPVRKPPRRRSAAPSR
ncbi:MAG TPA: hypothetical protein VML54_08805 [Candidatus Limnocylindrales bacterium]|nr:hypothetical protein [Candidatus Limnocylindrales bacterium]